MGFFFVLFLSLVVTNGNILNLPNDLQVLKQKTEVVVNKTPETKSTVQEIKPEPVKEETKPEPVKEEIKPEPVKSVTQELDTQKDSGTSYFRLILYIIGGTLVAFTGLYFFSSRRNSQSAISKVDADRKDIEENITPETYEEQPVEEPSQPETQEEPSQPETQEEPSADEDGNNNKK